MNLRNWRAREWDVAIEAAGLGGAPVGRRSRRRLPSSRLRVYEVPALDGFASPVRPAAYIRLERARGRRRDV